MVVLNSWKPSGRDILRKNVQEAFQWLGENALVLSMFNSQNAGDVPRCPYCYDGIYGASDTSGKICPYCYGTSYEGGIRAMWLCPILPSEPAFAELYEAKGQMAQELLRFQLPDYVEVWQDDFILRLNGWEAKEEAGTFTMLPSISRAYEIDTPQPQFVKDGLGYMGTEQRIGTVAFGVAVNIKHPICSVLLEGLPEELLNYSMPVPQPIQNENGALYIPYVKNKTNDASATSQTSKEPGSSDPRNIYGNRPPDYTQYGDF